MKTKNHFVWLNVAILMSFVITSFVLVGSALAWNFFHKEHPNGYNECLATSGNRKDFLSVQYACQKAYDGSRESGGESGQMACTGWIGPAGDSTTRTVRLTASSKDAVIGGLGFWGMCTDANPATGLGDTTKEAWVAPLNGPIGGHGVEGTGIEEKNFYRPPTWGVPQFTATSLHVRNFINGITPAIVNGQEVYTRQVMLDRQHSNNPSMGIDISTIIVTIGEPEEEPNNLCEQWMPISYKNSNSENGHTRIVVKARNTAGRFPEGESGDWHHDNDAGDEYEYSDLTGEIYAMPTDIIEWHSCYYPGVQMTAETRVSKVDDTIIGGKYPELSDTDCGNETLKYEELAKAYVSLLGKAWENKYTVGTDLGSGSGGEFGVGKYDLTEAQIQRGGNKTMGQVKGEHVGEELFQKGKTGKPKDATIVTSNEEKEVYKNNGPCCEKHDLELDGEVDCCSDEEMENKKKENPSWVPPSYDCRMLNCTNKYDEPGKKEATVTDESATDTARVKVPYNFKNSTGVKLASDTVYSAETIRVKEIWVDVGTRYNDKTYAEYATVVPEAKVKLFMYVSTKDNPNDEKVFSGDAACGQIKDYKQCKEVASAKLEDLNAGGSLYGTKDSSEDETAVGNKLYGMIRKEFNAFDASAGDYLCFVMAVTPYAVSSDVDMDGRGDGQWKMGSSDCALITKKPTFQVWGGNMYSNGGIKVSVAEKRHIYNAYINDIDDKFEPTATRADSTLYFSSWVEEGLNIRNGVTETLASGASTGNNNTSAGSGIKSAEKDFCTYRSPLTFANQCKNNGMGKSGIKPIITTTNKELIKYFEKRVGSCNSDMDIIDKDNSTGVTCELYESATNRQIKHVVGEGITISGGRVKKGETYLIEASGDVEVTGNLTYGNAGITEDSTPTTYKLVEDIPKVVISTTREDGSNSVNVHCNVKELHGIIFVKGTFKTCSDVETSKDGAGKCGKTNDDGVLGECNSPDRRRQLKVFGVVIAKKVNLGRTYGAAAWAPDYKNNNGEKPYSRDIYPNGTDGIPAEIFDYDSTIPIWAEFMSGAAESDTLQTVYQHELAPRY